MRLTPWMTAIRSLCFGARRQSGFQKRAVRRQLDAFERLEDRTLLTYTATVVGNDVTFTGDAAADTLTLDTSGGFLHHNRATAGDAGFASDIDLVSGDGATVTSILVTAVTSLTVNAGVGDDTVQLNGLNLSAATSLSVNGQGNTDVIETITGAVSVGGAAATVTLIGETININSALSSTTTTSLQSTTLNLANNVTATAISGTPTTVNVQNTTAQIQDGIDAAGTSATINIAAGSYTGSADATAGGKSVTLAPAGASGVGQVTLSGNLSLNTGDTLQIQINGSTPATNFDNFVVGGSVALNGASLVPTITFTPAVNTKLVIIDNTAGAVGGVFSGIAEGSFITISGQTFKITYVDGGNDVALTKYPGPVGVTYSGGSLIITGTDLDDDITVAFTGTNSVTLTGNGFTNFLGTGISGQTAGPFNVTGIISMTMKDGADSIYLRGIGGAAMLDSGSITIDLGAGNDTLTTTNATATTGLTLTGDITVVGGAGDDTVSLGGALAANTFAANAISIDTGAGVTQTVSLNRTAAGSNVTITNSGTGLQTAQVGNLGASSVGGNLTITQSATNTVGYAATVTDTGVGGNLTVMNGNSTGGTATTTISATSANRTVTGTTFVTNGNNTSNTINLTGTGFNLTLTKNITVTNGVATGANAINVNGVTGSALSAAAFTNGNGASNGITFGATRANSFLGMVSAVNGNALTTTNAITVDNTSIGKTTNFTNGNALTTNTITIGATTGVSSGGNIVLKNGAGTTSDTMLISQLTASADMTLSNGASGATTVTLGGAGANGITGNLVITNLATTGARGVTINNTSVSGRTGASINNSGAGISTVNIGVATLVTISGKLDVQDGTSDGTMRLDTVTVGSITYNDLGGGVDTINLANAAGTLTVSGVTRLNTGLGSDIINMATTGSTIFNDSVFISLSSGNDSLTIGANASSPAFMTGKKFQFDGDGGQDTITASPISLSDYTVGSIPKKLKSKITNFETIL